jgi:hypothetical protein
VGLFSHQNGREPALNQMAHAAVKGIHIEALESRVEGDIDLRGFRGWMPPFPKGIPISG